MNVDPMITELQPRNEKQKGKNKFLSNTKTESIFMWRIQQICVQFSLS